MKNYIAVVRSENGKIAKYQDFDTEAEADDHVAEYGGFVAENPGDHTDYWIVNTDAETLTYDGDQEAADAAALASTQYQYDRVDEYPPIGDQLDALFHAGVFPEDMEAQLQAVKDAHPK